jgi:hypothetical protein
MDRYRDRIAIEFISALGMPPLDRGRTVDQCGIFAEQASARDLDATLEFLPGMPVHDLPSALDVVRQVNRPNFRVLIDAMHFFRSGSDLTQLSVLNPSLIGHVQLCDVPLQSRYASYAGEARYDRLQPGEGELPLLDLLVALPADSIAGIEVPMLAKAEAGIGLHRLLESFIETSMAVLMMVSRLKARTSSRKTLRAAVVGGRVGRIVFFDRAVVEIITTCRTRSGLTYKNELLVLVRLRQDKIVSIYEHLDQQTSLEFEKLLQATAQGAA